MKLLRNLVIVAFLAFLACFATATPLAKANPSGAIVATAILALGVSWLLNDVRSPILRAITVSDDLKLDRILNTALIALKRKLLVLRAFSTVYRDVMLQGTDKVQVPFVPLDAGDSLDFDYDVGYETGDATLNSREVTVNKRKYQVLAVTGAQLARQPILMLEDLIVKKTEKLAEDVIADIFSPVTAANFGAAVFTGAAGTFDIDGVLAVRQACVDAMWPESGRALTLNSAFDTAALSDRDILNALNFGDSGPVQEGRIKRVAGFDYFPAPVLPANDENLVGFASLPSAILTAFSPIEPPPGVRKLMLDYRAVSDEETGLTLEFRHMADPLKDTDYHVVEVNYGSGKGDGAQLKRLVSA